MEAMISWQAQWGFDGLRSEKNRWYEVFMPRADKLYDDHLEQLRKKGQIDGSEIGSAPGGHAARFVHGTICSYCEQASRPGLTPGRGGRHCGRPPRLRGPTFPATMTAVQDVPLARQFVDWAYALRDEAAPEPVRQALRNCLLYNLTMGLAVDPADDPLGDVLASVARAPGASRLLGGRGSRSACDAAFINAGLITARARMTPIRRSSRTSAASSSRRCWPWPRRPRRRISGTPCCWAMS